MIARLIAAAGLVLFVSTGPAHATTPPPYYLRAWRFARTRHSAQRRR